MWKYPNVSPVLLGQHFKNSMGNPQMRVLEKCLFCNILYAIKWGNNGKESDDSSFLSVSLSIQITTKFYSSLFLNISPVHSFPIPTVTVFIQATILIVPDRYCSLLIGLLLSVSSQGDPPEKNLDFGSHHFFFFPLPPSYFFLSSPLARLAFRTC